MINNNRLSKYDKRALYIFYESEKDHDAFPNHKYKQSLNFDHNTANSLFKTLKNNFSSEISQYDLFKSFSKEKHYNSYLLYLTRKRDLSQMPMETLIKLFNSFEQFSFDDNDYSDDSIIIIQIISNIEKRSQLAIKLRTSHCSQCKMDQKICEYSTKGKKYLCNICSDLTEFTQKKNVQCRECKGEFDKATLKGYMITSCCQTIYCILCLKTHIKSKEQEAINNNDLGMITCFCNKSFEQTTITDIINNDNYKSLFEFNLDFTDPNNTIFYNDY